MSNKTITGLDVKINTNHLIALNRNDGINVSSNTFSTLSSWDSALEPADQLFKICEHAIAVDDLDYNYEDRWEVVRRWIVEMEADVDLEEVVLKQQNSKYLHDREDDYYCSEKLTPLHLILSHKEPPKDIVQIFLLEASVACAQGDAVQALPLSHACRNNVSSWIVQLLLKYYPDSARHMDRNNFTPMQLLLSAPNYDQATDAEKENATEIARLLCDYNAANQAGISGMFPLHIACAFGAPTSIVSILIKAYPDAYKTFRDEVGRTALHFAMSNTTFDSTKDTIRVLIENHPEIVNQYDYRNKLALHSFIGSLNKFAIDENHEKAQNIKDSLYSYLDGKPKPTTFYINTLAKLPEWLQVYAVEREDIKILLNKKITQRLPTMVLILDLYMYIFIAIYLPLTSRLYIGLEEVDKMDVVIIFIVAAYFLVREFIQIISSISLQSFTKWFYDPSNTIDITLIILLFYLGTVYNIDARCTEDANDTELARCSDHLIVIRFLAVCATTLIFICVISFIKSVLVEFSVFVNGVMYVLRRLFTFLIAMMIVIVAFAQIFFFLFQESKVCMSDEFPKFAHCSLPYSLLRTIQGLPGEVNINGYLSTNSAAFFFSLYIFVIIILLSNVLIAIVVDNYGVIQDERASAVFWSNRLDYVAEIDGSIASVLKLFGQKFDVNKVSFDETGKATWASLVNYVKKVPEIDEIVKLIYAFLFKIFAMAALLIWIIGGICSAGFLWPPQIREYFLNYKIKSGSTDFIEEVSLQVSKLRKEVHQMKDVSKKQMKNDRKEIIAMKEEAKSLQKDVIADMVQIREIMNMLLELKKQERGL